MKWASGGKQRERDLLTVVCGHKDLSCHLACPRDHRPHAPQENQIIGTVSRAQQNYIYTSTILCVICAHKCKHSYRHAYTNKHMHVESHSSSFSQVPYPLVAISMTQQVPLFLYARLIVLLSEAGCISLHLIPLHFDAQSPPSFSHSSSSPSLLWL